jgi:hypothetical protein
LIDFYERLFQILKRIRMSSKKAKQSDVPSEVEASVNALSCHPPVPPTQSGSPFERLSDEVILTIFSFLTHPQLCRIASVNKRLKTLALEPSLWKKITLDDDRPMRVETWRTIVSRCTQLESLHLCYQAVLRIRIRIHMFLGHPDPLVRGMDPDPDPALDPDPSIIMQK